MNSTAFKKSEIQHAFLHLAELLLNVYQGLMFLFHNVEVLQGSGFQAKDYISQAPLHLGEATSE